MAPFGAARDAPTWPLGGTVTEESNAMFSIHRTTILLVVFVPFVLHAASVSSLQPGNVILVNEEEIAGERTEVRFACPSGSVITGIGARAHYDNFTTLWVVYRPLRPDGTLGPPEEAHRGSEPDHACEALIRLPNPYVVCGFGARGAPEWDITTLWVWGRPLAPDGTLGSEKIFKDGFQPDHEGLERKAVDLRPQRVMTGAGLRFASNDVAGIWATSAEVFHLTGDSLGVRGAYFERPGPETVEAMRRFRHFFPEAEIWTPPGLAEPLKQELHNVPLRLVSDGFNDILRIGRENRGRGSAALPPVIRVRGEHVAAFLKRPVRGAVAYPVIETPGGLQAAKDLLEFDGPLSLPAEVGNAMARRVNPILGEDLPAGPASSPRRRLLAIDVGEALKGLPYVRAHRLAYLLLLARKHNLPVVFRFSSGWSLTGSLRPGEVPLRLAQGLQDRVATAPGDAIKAWAESRFGNGAEPCLAMLLRGESMCQRALSAGTFPLWIRGRFATVPEFRAALERRELLPWFPQTAAWWDRVAAPRERWIGDVVGGKRFVLAEIEGVLRALGEQERSITGAGAKEAVSELRTQFASLKALGQVTARMVEALLTAQLFSIDGAPATEKRLRGCVAELTKHGSAGSFGDLGPLVESLEKARQEAKIHNPMEAALAELQGLLDRGENEAAAKGFQRLFTDPVLSVNALKHRERVARLLSSLPLLWDGEPPADVRILWGGDGRYDLVKRVGKWGLMTTKRGPVAYGGWTERPMKEPTDLVMSLSYLDLPGQRIYFHYNSDFPGGLEDREYHRVQAAQTRGTGEWKSCEVILPRALFQGRQNENADYRLIGKSTGIVVRNIRVRKRTP